MNEIVFRVWDKQEKRFNPDYQDWIESNGSFWSDAPKKHNTPNAEIYCPVDRKRYDVMLRTVLKDRNGKELYFDSDLVRLPEYQGLWIATQDNYGIPVFVRPDNLLRGQISFESYFLSSGAKRIDDFEIIGTVQENPELLK